jgi:hypothetical protein
MNENPVAVGCALVIEIVLLLFAALVCIAMFTSL